jgi:hypothetical protein
MSLSTLSTKALIAFLLFSLTGCGGQISRTEESKTSTDYDDLVELFGEWREFQKPRLIEGVPDYTAGAMSDQFEELGTYRQQLDRIDPGGWPINQQVDYRVVLAEINGMDFDHRIRRPWSRDPAFYTLIHSARSDVPAHEGPNAFPPIELWMYDYPLNSADATELTGRIKTIPALLSQARGNLVEDARGLWMGGIRAMKSQSAGLGALVERVSEHSQLLAAISTAQQSTDEFRSWLEEELPSRNGPSGVGKDNYTWYLQTVHLIPYTWEEEVTIMRRELARAHASLRLEEHRNQDLPPLERIDNSEEYDRRHHTAAGKYMAFLEDGGFMTVKDYMDAALRAQIGSFFPSSGLRGFFYEVSYREPLALITHFHHWIELAQMDNEPHSNPIRRDPLPYNIFDGRSEGLATGIEEMSMHAGLFDDNPRARELVWIMLAQRAARAIAGLHLHSNDWSMEEAVKFASDWTPRGWMPADSNTVWGEQHLYLKQPGYGTSYVIGKIEIEALIAERASQLGSEFTMKRFMDEFRAAGLIPVSLIRWELTGQPPNIALPD